MEDTAKVLLVRLKLDSSGVGAGITDLRKQLKELYEEQGKKAAEFSQQLSQQKAALKQLAASQDAITAAVAETSGEQKKQLSNAKLLIEQAKAHVASEAKVTAELELQTAEMKKQISLMAKGGVSRASRATSHSTPTKPTAAISAPQRTVIRQGVVQEKAENDDLFNRMKTRYTQQFQLQQKLYSEGKISAEKYAEEVGLINKRMYDNEYVQINGKYELQRRLNTLTTNQVLRDAKEQEIAQKKLNDLTKAAYVAKQRGQQMAIPPSQLNQAGITPVVTKTALDLGAPATAEPVPPRRPAGWSLIQVAPEEPPAHVTEEEQPRREGRQVPTRSPLIFPTQEPLPAPIAPIQGEAQAAALTQVNTLEEKEAATSAEAAALVVKAEKEKQQAFEKTAAVKKETQTVGRAATNHAPEYYQPPSPLPPVPPRGVLQEATASATATRNAAEDEISNARNIHQEKINNIDKEASAQRALLSANSKYAEEYNVEMKSLFEQRMVAEKEFIEAQFAGRKKILESDIAGENTRHRLTQLDLEKELELRKLESRFSGGPQLAAEPRESEGILEKGASGFLGGGATGAITAVAGGILGGGIALESFKEFIDKMREVEDETDKETQLLNTLASSMRASPEAADEFIRKMSEASYGMVSNAKLMEVANVGFKNNSKLSQEQMLALTENVTKLAIAAHGPQGAAMGIEAMTHFMESGRVYTLAYATGISHATLAMDIHTKGLTRQAQQQQNVVTGIEAIAKAAANIPEPVDSLGTAMDKQKKATEDLWIAFSKLFTTASPLVGLINNLAEATDWWAKKLESRQGPIKGFISGAAPTTSKGGIAGAAEVAGKLGPGALISGLIGAYKGKKQEEIGASIDEIVADEVKKAKFGEKKLSPEEGKKSRKAITAEVTKRALPQSQDFGRAFSGTQIGFQEFVQQAVNKQTPLPDEAAPDVNLEMRQAEEQAANDRKQQKIITEQQKSELDLRLTAAEQDHAKVRVSDKAYLDAKTAILNDELNVAVKDATQEYNISTSLNEKKLEKKLEEDTDYALARRSIELTKSEELSKASEDDAKKRNQVDIERTDLSAATQAQALSVEHQINDQRIEDSKRVADEEYQYGYTSLQSRQEAERQAIAQSGAELQLNMQARLRILNMSPQDEQKLRGDTLVAQGKLDDQLFDLDMKHAQEQIEMAQKVAEESISIAKDQYDQIQKYAKEGMISPVAAVTQGTRAQQQQVSAQADYVAVLSKQLAQMSPTVDNAAYLEQEQKLRQANIALEDFRIALEKADTRLQAGVGQFGDLLTTMLSGFRHQGLPEIQQSFKSLQANISGGPGTIPAVASAGFSALLSLFKPASAQPQPVFSASGPGGTDVTTPASTAPSFDQKLSQLAQGLQPVISGLAEFASIIGNANLTVGQALGKGAEAGGGLGSALKGAVQGPDGIGQALKGVGGAVGAVGGVLSAAAPFMPIIGSLIGGLVGMISGIFERAARRIGDTVQNSITKITLNFEEGSATLATTLTSLQAQKATLIQQESGQKYGQNILNQMLPQLNQQIAQLIEQQQQIINTFQAQAEVLSYGPGFTDVANQINQIIQQWNQYISAGGDVVQANQYLIESFQQLDETTVNQLDQSYVSAIQNALQYNDLLIQRQQLVQSAAEQEESIMNQGVLVRQYTTAQTKAFQIGQIQEQTDQQLEQLNEQIQVSQYQLQVNQQVFDLTGTRVDLENKLAAVQMQVINYDMIRISALSELVSEMGKNQTGAPMGSLIAQLIATYSQGIGATGTSYTQLTAALAALGISNTSAPTATNSPLQSLFNQYYQQLARSGNYGTATSTTGVPGAQ